jgi:hypothetical protein
MWGIYMTFKCPLERPVQYIEDFKTLVSKCKEEKCSYLYCTDGELPYGCVLFVAAILKSKEESD